MHKAVTSTILVVKNWRKFAWSSMQWQPKLPMQIILVYLYVFDSGPEVVRENKLLIDKLKSRACICGGDSEQRRNSKKDLHSFPVCVAMSSSSVACFNQIPQSVSSECGQMCSRFVPIRPTNIITIIMCFFIRFSCAFHMTCESHVSIFGQHE